MTLSPEVRSRLSKFVGVLGRRPRPRAARAIRNLLYSNHASFPDLQEIICEESTTEPVPGYYSADVIIARAKSALERHPTMIDNQRAFLENMIEKHSKRSTYCMSAKQLKWFEDLMVKYAGTARSRRS
jgi:hypothetical protein